MPGTARRIADGSDRQVDRTHVLGDFRHGCVLLGSIIDRHAIGGQRHLTGQEGAVVVDVLPAFGAGNEGLVELLRIFTEALSVSGLLMTTFPLSSTILPPWLHSSQCA
jgi:hypothetical protein